LTCVNVEPLALAGRRALALPVSACVIRHHGIATDRGLNRRRTLDPGAPSAILPRERHRLAGSGHHARHGTAHHGARPQSKAVLIQIKRAMQKFYTLQIHKGLIEDELFSYTRNPNYLGEILIYSAYAILSWHWLPFLVLAAWVFGFFVPNMLAKDKSMSRHPSFAAYKARTGMLFPRFWPVSPRR
jgi:hypothetical protein